MLSCKLFYSECLQKRHIIRGERSETGPAVVYSEMRTGVSERFNAAGLNFSATAHMSFLRRGRGKGCFSFCVCSGGANLSKMRFRCSVSCPERYTPSCSITDEKSSTVTSPLRGGGNVSERVSRLQKLPGCSKTCLCPVTGHMHSVRGGTWRTITWHYKQWQVPSSFAVILGSLAMKWVPMGAVACQVKSTYCAGRGTRTAGRG